MNKTTHLRELLTHSDDILFANAEHYQLVKASGRLHAQTFAELYACPVETVHFFACDNAFAFKFSIPAHFLKELWEMDTSMEDNNLLR